MTPIRRVLASALLTATALTVGAGIAQAAAPEAATAPGDTVRTEQVDRDRQGPEGETTQADDAETAMEVLRILLGPSSPLGDMLELDLEGLEGVLLS
ncbi:hypothetical protein [Saccharomonospora viridis]|jgi:hypothetical protein|uniref:Uncharacterized protein n=2 Tax=Saccharomonospora viridis TaxID=1852 RepID=C7MST0_SACVD|nr:hypothetical protein [Saccharomonospora viridis]ACU95291.1 hypothetical protein Svir_02090 [Saccharomonospora viridis DSM 43017]KHF44922.1 hypothetical protein MINT15_18040 [Saccharomonospora viridis]SFP17739.1 hypothetical protein SAMN02982918_1524 [Saccharomonospora viridis]